MPGLDPSFVMHNLPLKEGAKPIKPKPRKMHPYKALLVKKRLKNTYKHDSLSQLTIMSGYPIFSLSLN